EGPIGGCDRVRGCFAGEGGLKYILGGCRRIKRESIDPQLGVGGVLGFNELTLAEIGEQVGRGRGFIDDEVVACPKVHASDLQPVTAAVVDHAGANIIAIVRVGVDEARELGQGRGAGDVDGDLPGTGREDKSTCCATAYDLVRGGKNYR